MPHFQSTVQFAARSGHFIRFGLLKRYSTGHNNQYFFLEGRLREALEKVALVFCLLKRHHGALLSVQCCPPDQIEGELQKKQKTKLLT